MEDNIIKHCNQCPNCCPIDAVQCGKGRQFVKKLELEKNDEHLNTDYETDTNIHDHEQSKHKSEKKDSYDCGFHRSWWGNASRDRERLRERNFRSGHSDHKGRSRFCFRGHLIEEEDELVNLLRACGHYTFHNVGNGQEWIIHILSHMEEISQKELQNIMHIQPGSISELLAKLERAGFIAREKDIKDKRRTIVKITETGKQHSADFHNDESKKDLFSALNEEQKEQLKQLLELLLESWNE